ncbi:MAG: hypothetical protein U0670_18180 [Anaerolineae bacterium]
MSLSGVIAAIALLVIGSAWVLLPFLRGGVLKSEAERAKDREELSIAAAYERTLMTVRDLDEDFQVGKLPQEVYAAERARWAEHGAKLLHMMEAETAAEQPKKSKHNKHSHSTDAAAKTVTANTASSGTDDPVEAAIAAYAKARERARD